MSDEEQGMYDLRGWRRAPCIVSDTIRSAPETKVFSSLTDLDGQYGHAVMYTEWGVEIGEGDDKAYLPVLREYYWPKDKDRDCEHFVPEYKKSSPEDVVIAARIIPGEKE